MKTVSIKRWERHSSLAHGYSTKELGNLSVRLGNSPELRARREEFARAFGVDWNDTFFLPLSHSNNVLSLPKGSLMVKDREGQYISGGKMFGEVTGDGIDAVVTNVKGLFPVVLPADCASVAFFDPKKEICALAHAGLRGAISGLAGRVARCMVEDYACDPGDIEVVIYPSIHGGHYHVDRSSDWKTLCERYGVPAEGDAAQVAIMRQLVAAGIPEGNVFDTGVCTACDRDRFFSNFVAATEEGKKLEGRFGTIVGMRR